MIDTRCTLPLPPAAAERTRGFRVTQNPLGEGVKAWCRYTIALSLSPYEDVRELHILCLVLTPICGSLNGAVQFVDGVLRMVNGECLGSTTVNGWCSEDGWAVLYLALGGCHSGQLCILGVVGIICTASQRNI